MQSPQAQSKQMRLEIRPRAHGEDAESSTCGVHDAVIGSELRSALLHLLCVWSGRPVSLAFPANYYLANLFELWAESIDEARPSDLEIRFMFDRRALSPGNGAAS